METKVRRLYDIDIFKLDSGEHHFEMEVNDAFFTLFNFGLIEKGQARINIELHKTETMMTLDFVIKGGVELTCDRSLEAFEYPIELRERLIVKFGEEEVDLDDDILIITQNTQKINLAQFIYEIIGISLPMKKIHPDYQEEEEDELSEGKLVYSSGPDEQDEKESEEDESVDPRWNVLKNLKNN